MLMRRPRRQRQAGLHGLDAVARRALTSPSRFALRHAQLCIEVARVGIRESVLPGTALARGCSDGTRRMMMMTRGSLPSSSSGVARAAFHASAARAYDATGPSRAEAGSARPLAPRAARAQRSGSVGPIEVVPRSHGASRPG